MILNEILADPATGVAGDANHDGTTSSSEDEFLEFVNVSDQVLNISGWSISDSVRTRHVFLANSWLSPNQAFVVFGGGQPEYSSFKWQTASEGSLGLNNAGDTISLFDAQDQLIWAIVYDGLAGQNESIVLSEELTGSQYTLHSEVSASGKLYSPGTDADGELFAVEQAERGDPVNNPATVPEPVLFPLAALLVGMMRRKIGC